VQIKGREFRGKPAVFADVVAEKINTRNSHRSELAHGRHLDLARVEVAEKQVEPTFGAKASGSGNGAGPSVGEPLTVVGRRKREQASRPIRFRDLVDLVAGLAEAV
jgi:hypothetical protein